MATAAVNPAMNPAYLVDPSLYGSQQQVDQQQQLAALLMQQGLTPMSGTEMAGQVAIRKSPLEGAAKLAALLSGQNLQQSANQGQSALAQRQAAAMGSMFGFAPPQGQSPVSGQPGGQPQGAPAQGGPQAGPMSVAGASPMTNYMSYATDPAAHMKAVMEQYSQTPEMKMAAQMFGVGSPQYLGVLSSLLAKSTHIPLDEVKAGNTAIDPITRQPVAFGVKVPEGAQPTFGPDGKMTSMQMVPGAQESMAAGTAATGAGTATNDMMSIELPDGRKQNMTRAQAIQYANGGQQGAGYQFQVRPGTEAQMRAQIERSGDYAALGAFDKQQGSPSMPGFSSGQGTTAAAAANQAGTLPQKTLEERYTQVRDANQQAETTNSYLQSIKQLSDKAATGQFSDRQQFVNSLLSYAGVSEKATDAVTAKNLLDKYGNQITARLGQGALGTDAARSLLQAAYPNSHMTPDAIREASDNLIAANKMIQAKARILGPAYDSRDTNGYSQKERAFDQVADPRIFQIAEMPPAQAQTYLSALSPQDKADLRKRAAALKQMGAF